MFLYKLEYTIEKVLSQGLTEEQKLLQFYGNKNFSKEEAAKVWERIKDHKWYIGERLQRDVGFKVAVVDYLENFYQPPIKRESKNRRFGSITKIFRPANLTV